MAAFEVDNSGNFVIDTPAYKASGGPTDLGSALLSLKDIDPKNFGATLGAVLPLASMAFPVLGLAMPVLSLLGNFSIFSSSASFESSTGQAIQALSQQVNAVYTALASQIDKQTETLLNAMSAERQRGMIAAIKATEYVSELMTDEKNRLLEAYEQAGQERINDFIESQEKETAIYNKIVNEGKNVYFSELEIVDQLAFSKIGNYLDAAAEDAMAIAVIQKNIEDLREIDPVKWCNKVFDEIAEAMNMTKRFYDES